MGGSVRAGLGKHTLLYRMELKRIKIKVIDD